MPRFEIATLERWTTVVEYIVQAPSLEEAQELIETGKATWDSHEHTGDDTILTILEVDGVKTYEKDTRLRR